MAHVLVVEDDADLRMVLRDVLESEGYDVSEAADTPSGLAALRASLVPMVVLLDLVMPGLDGMEFLRAVAEDPALASRHAYILVTGSTPDRVEVPDKVGRLLAVPVVFRPFELDDFLAAVATAARRLEGT